MADDTRNSTVPATEAGAAPTYQEEPTPSVPAGEPEAPVAPVSPDPGSPPDEESDDGALPEEESDDGALPDEESDDGPLPGEDGDDGPLPGEDGDDGPTPDEDDDEALADEDSGEEPDHEAKLADDLEELTARARKADQYLELAQRTKADFENYRKRAAREASAALERGVLKLTRELLPAVDNLDRALEAATPGDGADLLAGIKLVQAEVLSALARVGVEPFDPQGEPFNPTCHEAVAQQPVEGAQAGTVAEVYQRGYRLGETVIRPARVLVAG